jgi:DNA-binding response OmpR family regulator
MKTQVLLVEDDRNVLKSLAAYLDDEGFSVVPAETIASAKKLMSKQIDLVILDWMLPDGQGIDFLKALRSDGYGAPVILLTAKGDLVDKVLGLESGADDYLVKPFEPRELLTRMRVRLRASLQGGGPVAEPAFGGIEIHARQRTAKFRGRPLCLTKLEFDLLQLFVDEPGRVFTREEILNKVWGFEIFPTTRTVDNHVVQLRQKIEPAMFETVRGVGYRLIARGQT